MLSIIMGLVKMIVPRPRVLPGQCAPLVRNQNGRVEKVARQVYRQVRTV